MKAIILARVSDKKQDSNEAQLGRISDIPSRFSAPILKIYEIEESSTKGDRKQFQNVVKDIETSSEEILLVVDTVDRLQRSFKESVLLDDHRKAGKLRIHFYRENLTIHKDSNSADLLRWDMAVMFARSYVLQLSDNVKRKQEQMLRNGEWTGRPPLGYKSVYNEKNERIDIVPDPDKAHFIVKMFELYATGNYSTKTIRVELAKMGLLSSVGKQLALSMVDYILNNTFYYGVMKGKGKEFPHKYKPLIPKELFDRCQDVRKSWCKKPFKYASKPFIFRGLLRCARCGCAMSPEIKKGKYVYYSCTNARKDICSEKLYPTEKELLKPVYEVLEAFEAIPQDVVDDLVNDLRSSNEAKTVYHKNALESLQKEYLRVQDKIDSLLDLLLDHSITKDEYDKKLKSLKDKQYDINIQIEDHTRADENYYITASTVLNLAKQAKKLFESSEIEEKRALLNFLLQNSTVDGKKLAFTLASPFDEILKLSNQPIGLPR